MESIHSYTRISKTVLYLVKPMKICKIHLFSSSKDKFWL